ncbi:MAG: HAMP domain-containing protein [Acidobacteria bacterium]|nr:HAMP domain-containing protein [Acidobacteriota bacterium]
MTFRWSLRKKLVYTVLAASLLTVLLFGVVIQRIIDDYFEQQSAARQTFIREQGVQAVRANLTLFKARLRNMGGTTALRTLSVSGILADRLPDTQAEREEIAKTLRAIQTDARLSFVTIVDVNGRVVVRATNPAVYGDDTLMREYENPQGPVSSIRHLLDEVIAGKTIQSFEAFAPEILALENAIENGKTISSLKDQVATPLRGRDIAPGTFERRALTMTFATPIRTPRGEIVGAVLAGRIINKDNTIVQDIRNLLQDHATIFLGTARVASTLSETRGPNRGKNVVGTLHTAARVTSGEYVERFAPGIEGGTMGVFDPIRDHQNTAIGSFWIGRPLALMQQVAASQRQLELGFGRRATIYIIILAVASTLISIVVASFFARRVTGRIDQLRRGAAIIEQGQLDHRLNIKSGDEIELVSKQFNSMASKLQESHQNLEAKVEERTRELQKSQETMIQQEKMVGIGQLAAGVAHELNTPLGTIIGYAQMLREDLAQQPQSAANLADVEEIVEQTGRCRDLVKNLLNFSRRSTTEKANADMNAIVRKIASLVEHDFDMKRVRLHLDLDPRLPSAKVNENEIGQVILNLANNAVDSMPDGGNLFISTNYNEEFDRIRIDVHDTGCGILESDRNRVFEPFFTTKEVGKGTGLGLSICYKIVENHLGSMEFDTVEGQGTTFRVYLPVNAEVRVG